jgi:hypothetical protein
MTLSILTLRINDTQNNRPKSDTQHNKVYCDVT